LLRGRARGGERQGQGQAAARGANSMVHASPRRQAGAAASVLGGRRCCERRAQRPSIPVVVADQERVAALAAIRPQGAWARCRRYLVVFRMRRSRFASADFRQCRYSPVRIFTGADLRERAGCIALREPHRDSRLPLVNARALSSAMSPAIARRCIGPRTVAAHADLSVYKCAASNSAAPRVQKKRTCVPTEPRCLGSLSFAASRKCVAAAARKRFPSRFNKPGAQPLSDARGRGRWLHSNFRFADRRAAQAGPCSRGARNWACACDRDSSAKLRASLMAWTTGRSTHPKERVR